ncbi:hypothetical protein BGZ52_003602 [Haplosporangium bisporale]|nr:hypothetical protein BGZ52_003602 [Haplosporangium bisporale]
MHDGDIPRVPTKVKQPDDDGNMSEKNLTRNVWTEIKPQAKVKIANLITLVFEPYDAQDLPAASWSRAGSSMRGHSSVDLGQQTTQSFGDREATRSYEHSRYSQISRSTGPPENIAQESTSSSRVPSSQSEEVPRPVHERHILRELGLGPGIDGEELHEYEHNVPDDELCTLSLCDMTESYWSYYNSYSGERDEQDFNKSRKGKERASDSAETTPPRAHRVQVPFRMLPPELTQPSAYYLAQSIPGADEEPLSSDAGGSNQEESNEEPDADEEQKEAGEQEGTIEEVGEQERTNEEAGEQERTDEEAGDKENANEETDEKEGTKESDKTLQVSNQPTKEDPSQASTAAAASASASESASSPTLSTSQESSLRTSPKKTGPKFVADGPDSENIEPSATRSQSVSPDKRSSKPLGPPAEDAPRQLRSRTQASVKLTKIDGNKDDKSVNNTSRRADSIGAPMPPVPEAANVASEPLTPTQKRSRSRSTYQLDPSASRPGGKIGRRRN